MKYQVCFTVRAKRSIDDYIDYIAHDNQEPVNADRVLQAIYQSTILKRCHTVALRLQKTTG